MICVLLQKNLIMLSNENKDKINKNCLYGFLLNKPQTYFQIINQYY